MGEPHEIQIDCYGASQVISVTRTYTIYFD